jgi:hypothetical protein
VICDARHVIRNVRYTYFLVANMLRALTFRNLQSMPLLGMLVRPMIMVTKSTDTLIGDKHQSINFCDMVAVYVPVALPMQTSPAMLISRIGVSQTGQSLTLVVMDEMVMYVWSQSSMHTKMFDVCM